MNMDFKEFIGVIAIGYGMGLLKADKFDDEVVDINSMTLEDFNDAIELIDNILMSVENSKVGDAIDKISNDLSENMSKTLKSLEDSLKILSEKVNEAKNKNEDEKIDNVPEVEAQVVDSIDIAIIEAINELNELAKKKQQNTESK